MGLQAKVMIPQYIVFVRFQHTKSQLPSIFLQKGFDGYLNVEWLPSVESTHATLAGAGTARRKINWTRKKACPKGTSGKATVAIITSKKLHANRSLGKHKTTAEQAFQSQQEKHQAILWLYSVLEIDRFNRCRPISLGKAIPIQPESNGTSSLCI